MLKSTSVTVRFRDLDAYNHVNHAEYFTYMETARTDVFKDVIDGLLRSGRGLIVKTAECEYIYPIALGDTLIIDMRFEEAGKTGIMSYYDFHNGAGRKYAEGRVHLVSYDLNKGRPVRMFEEVKGCIQ